MLHMNIKVILKLKGPVLTKSTSIGAYGIDSPMAIDENNRYYLPGTLLKGRIREAMHELHNAAADDFSPDIAALLGEETGNREKEKHKVEPQRGLLHFSDFTCTSKQDEDSKIRYRISIDKDRKAVKKNAFLVIETPFGVGECVCFKGNITFCAKDMGQTEKIFRCVKIAMRWVSSFGAERTVGFGSMEDVSLTMTPLKEDVLVPPQNLKTPFYLAIKPRAAFCIAKKRIDGNLFESETVIPGSVLKGTVASTWKRLLGKGTNAEIDSTTDPLRKELCKYFDKICFSAAFPADEIGVRPVVPPLSLVKKGKEELRDVALCEAPTLYVKSKTNNKNKSVIKYIAPSFAVDWKDETDVMTQFGWPKLKPELRVHTAIDSEKLRAAKSKLFAYESIQPGDCTWYGSVDILDDENEKMSEKEKRKVMEQLCDVMRYGIHGLSKTGVSADVKAAINMSNKHSSYYDKPRDGVWVLTLQTPAIIGDPEELDRSSGCKELKEVYNKALFELSGENLTLERCFTKEYLAGSYYLYKRFQKDNEYYPYFITDKGSVFVFKVAEGKKENDAQEQIKKWTRYGLPLPGWAIERYKNKGVDGSHWSNCPYIPQNGFGEIAVNLDVHWNIKLEGETVNAI